MSTYPRCANSFINSVKLNKKLFNKYINSNLLNVRPFDVTLRDGLQALTIDQQNSFTTSNKKKLYDFIVNNHSPKNIEIGSCVNKNLLPIFNDTESIFKFAERYNKKMNIYNHYVLVPNLDNLISAVNIGFKNFSFITSVSNSFQIKNTKMTLDENYNNINNMLAFLDDSPLKDYNIKLYVSCINKCPIEGNIMISTIVDNLVKLHKLRPNKICLSDTCGELEPIQLFNIIQGLIFNRIDLSKISLHLHVKPERELEVEKIVHIAIDHGINEFDVSAVNTGGCSVTMDKKQLAPNMSYDQYYKFLTSYLIKNM